MASLLPPQPAPAPRPRGGLARSSAGQASAEYTALLAVVAVALAGAGAAAGAAAVPARVVHGVRIALCIVGGDVCRRADAEAAGLEPCLTHERATGRGLALTVVSVRLGRRGSWTVAQRSDGSVLVTRVEDDQAGLSGGLGVEMGGIGVTAGVSGAVELSLARGRAWELASPAAAARLIAAVRGGDEPPTAPTWRFGDLGEELTASLGASAGGLDLTAVEGSAGASAGVRTGRGETTVYVHAHADASSPFVSLPGPVGTTSGAPDGGDGGPLLVGITRDRHGLRELSFEHAARGPGQGEVVETVARLDLREPANRAAAEQTLSAALPWPRRVLDGLRTLARRAVQTGTVERAVYALRDRSSDLSAALKLGVELGVDASRLDVERRLVDASAWTAGSPQRRRVDCLGEEVA